MEGDLTDYYGSCGLADLRCCRLACQPRRPLGAADPPVRFLPRPASVAPPGQRQKGRQAEDWLLRKAWDRDGSIGGAAKTIWTGSRKPVMLPILGVSLDYHQLRDSQANDVPTDWVADAAFRSPAPKGYGRSCALGLPESQNAEVPVAGFHHRE